MVDIFAFISIHIELCVEKIVAIFFTCILTFTSWLTGEYTLTIEFSQKNPIIVLKMKLKEFSELEMLNFLSFKLALGRNAFFGEVS